MALWLSPPATFVMLVTTMLITAVSVKLAEMALLAVRAALMVTWPDAALERVTLVDTRPWASEVELVGFNVAAPAGETVHVTACPDIALAPVESMTFATSGAGRACPGLALCPLPLET